MLYLEDIKGKATDGYRLKNICAYAQAIWREFQSIGCLPTTWGRADAEMASVYHHKMHLRFFEFGLCHNNWKADLLATESYPSWYNNHGKVNAVKNNSMAKFKQPLTMELLGAPSKKAKVTLSSSNGPDSSNFIGSKTTYKEVQGHISCSSPKTYIDDP